MLQPKRTKHRKAHRGRRAGMAKGGTRVEFGEYGLKALDRGWITNRQIEAARIAMTRKIKRGGKVWINKGEIMPSGFAQDLTQIEAPQQMPTGGDGRGGRDRGRGGGPPRGRRESGGGGGQQ
ncbi:MAG: 50S ribosomal protein L16, partial [Actinobacteria bacterium]